MTPTGPGIRLFRLEELTVDAASGEIVGPGGAQHLEPKVMGVLVALAERPAEVVTRDELLARVWPGLVVSDDSISRTVYRLRQQLARAGGDERYRSMLETLPKRGYRLTARVQPIGDPPATHAVATDGTSSLAVPSPPGRGRSLLSLGAALAAVVLVAAFLGRDVHDAPTGQRVTAPATILVLPFADLSAQGDQDYFAAGLAEEVRTRLARSPDIRVIGRTSSEAFNPRSVDMPAIASQLGVTHALEASVRNDGQRVRIAARLLDDTGIPVWDDSFDRDLRGVLELQSEIAGAVARAVSAQFVPRQVADRMPGFDAYDAYLAGRDLLYRRDYRGARRILERATGLDPDFAAAHAEFAISLAIGWPAAENLARADRAIARALEIEPGLVRAQAARALWLLQTHPPDPVSAERLLRDVIAREPGMSDGLLWLANALADQGREDEAFEVLQRAIRTDPWHPAIVVNVASGLADRGDSDAAIAMLEQQIDRPNAPYALYDGLRNLYLQHGRIAAIHELGQAQSLAVAGQPHFILAFGYGSLALWPQATYWLERSMHELPDRWPVPFFDAIVPMWRGEFAEAARRFETVMKERGFALAQHDLRYSEWFGTLLAYAGRHAEAIEILAPLYVDALLVRLPVVAVDSLYAPHALAGSYRAIGDDARATALLAAIEERCRTRAARGTLHGSELIFVCAQNALLRGDIELALLRLEQAVANGWRSYHLTIEQPFWKRLRGNPRFDALMAQVATDLGRQRAEVQRRDAEVDFIARLDAAIAARQRRVADPTSAAAAGAVRSSARGSQVGAP